MYPYLVFDILVLVGNDGILTDCPWLLMVLTEQFCPTTGAGNTDFSRRKTVLRISWGGELLELGARREHPSHC